MIVKLRLLFDYKCYPVWLYDEIDNIEDTLLPEDLRDDLELDNKFDNLQSRYDELFLDNGKEFKYIGFKSEEEKASFISDWQKAVKELCDKVGDKYQIVDDATTIVKTL